MEHGHRQRAHTNTWDPKKGKRRRVGEPLERIEYGRFAVTAELVYQFLGFDCLQVQRSAPSGAPADWYTSMPSVGEEGVHQMFCQGRHGNLTTTRVPNY